MGIRFFRGERIRYEHEYHQVKEIVGILSREFQKEPVYVLTNVLVANGQIDCIILTRSGPLILELKAFSGEIHGIENGSWEVITGDGPIQLPNLFFQARSHRQDFIDRLIPIFREHLPHIPENNLRKMGSWLYFSKGSSYPQNQIDVRRVKWFRIVTADSLLEAMRFLDSGYTLRLQDMDAIVQGLHLEEYQFETGKPLAARPGRAPKSFRLSRGNIAVIAIILLVIGILALVMLVPGARTAMMSTFSGMGAVLSGMVKERGRDLIKSNSGPADAQEAMVYLNRIRIAEGLAPVPHDDRAFGLALSRSADMAAFRYLDYTNPETGESARTLMAAFGVPENSTVVESAYGQWNGYTYGIEQHALDTWMSDEGNRNRLFAQYTGGSIACTKGYCSFIGIRDMPETTGVPEVNGENVTAQES
ncbi:MAG TPA: NERD domain-containing protein [Methanoregulaceae archaeon]|nr:MAG: NERD domain-containing protein [Methanolinea sp.]HON81474.1 NERD domain-containing protein [Methanoregulaceae archaeon]HPD09998.1 NERD domain-containing protein [Methanoregulaceae archaeon]HRT15004.1 NERD domain-containing protein [Methanoregulaceae archaeon]HRU30575.1 NERD domain-containing protein [Methanoregulaceae archaeon]